MIAYVDYPDGGPIADEDALERLLEKPGLFLSSLIFREAPELLDKVVAVWASVGNARLAEATYAYILQLRRGVIDERELLLHIVEMFKEMEYVDLLALQRALMIGIGRTTCDLGAAIFVENPRLSLYGLAYDMPPKGVLASSAKAKAYLVVNIGERKIVDLDTMCVVPYSPSGRLEELHMLQRLHEAGFAISTREKPRCWIVDAVADGGAVAPRYLAKLLGIKPCS